jgi:hypothetical protein
MTFEEAAERLGTTPRHMRRLDDCFRIGLWVWGGDN